MADAEIVMAKDAYIDYPAANVPVRIDKGKTARAGHPLVKRTPLMWVPIKVDYEVEQKSETTKQTAKKAGP